MPHERTHPGLAPDMISSKGWDSMYVLVHRDDKRNVAPRERLTSKDGVQVTVTGGSAPHKSGSTGRVYVEENGTDKSYFPGVYDLEWMSYGRSL